MSFPPHAPTQGSPDLAARLEPLRSGCGGGHRPWSELVADADPDLSGPDANAGEAPRTPLTCEGIEQLARRVADGRLLLLADTNPAGESCDIVVAAPHATADALNFMNRFGGLLRLAITQSRARRLRLHPMVHDQRPNAETYTVSIEARHGVTTGISTHDRALTIRTALDATNDQDLVSPGHVFPVIVADGGVSERAGAADAAIYLLSRVASEGSAVLSKVLDEDGRCLPAGRGRDFARAHGLLFASLADVVAGLRAAPRGRGERAA